MKLWQLLGLISGSIITTVMAVASVSYTTTLATTDLAFASLPIPNTALFAVLAIAFDLGIIVSVFGMLHWWSVSRMRAVTCICLFAIASAYSIHAVRGYIALNVTKAAAPAVRATDLYASLKLELAQVQAHLGQLQATYADADRRERRRLDTRIAQARGGVSAIRDRLARADVPVHVSPLAGLEWFLAVTLWFFNATCWSAWFGATPPARETEADTVVGWLADCDQSQPQHCAAMFSDYANWCERIARPALPKYSFYARLIELGARKFRDGRNGPTMYALPDPRD
jgi:hypothetical protein